MTFLPLVFGYLGPETMLPMTSVVAGVMGVVMMFGRSSIRWMTGTFRRFAPQSKPVTSSRRISPRPVAALESPVRQ